jgi:cytochrome c553
MKRMKQGFAIGLALGWLAPAAAFAVTGDAVAARDKISMCMGCHGIPGYKTAFPYTYHVPKIGGQHAAYIVKALQAYKSGDRKHPSMRAIAASLSEQDMADLAAYYSNTAPAAPAAKK